MGAREGVAVHLARCQGVCAVQEAATAGTCDVAQDNWQTLEDVPAVCNTTRMLSARVLPPAAVFVLDIRRMLL